MIHIFYFLSIFAIAWELFVLYDPERLINFFQKYENNKEDIKLKKAMTNLSLFYSLYFIWILIGLLTSSWFLYLILLLLGLVKKSTVLSYKIDASLSLFLIIFAILNNYLL